MSKERLLPVRHDAARRPADAGHRLLARGQESSSRKCWTTFGLDYVEGGYPGANPTDTAFFQAKRTTRAKFTAFGMVKRAGRSVSNDPGVQDLLRRQRARHLLRRQELGFSRRSSRSAVRTRKTSNQSRIFVAAAVAAEREALLDCEHFFDGYKANPAYALACVEAALVAGARWAVLCDTNGGTLPDEVEAIVSAVVAGSRRSGSASTRTTIPETPSPTR